MLGCPAPGCWCAEGLVMNRLQQCVLPEECWCEASGATHWPGQQMKLGCDVCVCERGRAQRCRPNPDCPGTPLLSGPGIERHLQVLISEKQLSSVLGCLKIPFSSTLMDF